MIANKSTSLASCPGSNVYENVPLSNTSEPNWTQQRIFAYLSNQRSNPFENAKEKNFPPLDEFFQLGTDEHSDSDVLHDVDATVISNGGSSFISNANLSIGARASINEHQRHIAKHGIDESMSSSQKCLQHFEYSSRNRLELDRYSRTNLLDYVWERLLDSSVLHGVASIECSDELEDFGSERDVLLESRYVPSDSIDRPVDKLLRRSKIVYNQSHDDEAIEVVNESSLSDYFASSNVLLLRTPEKNMLYRERVTTRRDFGLDGAANDCSYTSESFDDRPIIPTICRVAQAMNVPKSEKSLFDIDILDLSRISADGSDVERFVPNLNTSFGMVENSFLQPVDESLNNSTFAKYNLETPNSFDSLSPVRKDLAKSLSKGNKTSDRRRSELPSLAAIVTPSVAAPSNSPGAPTYETGSEENRSHMWHNPARSKSRSILSSATSDNHSFENEITPSLESRVCTDGLSAVTKQAAERASLFLKQLNSKQSTNDYRSTELSPTDPLKPKEEKLLRTMATPFLESSLLSGIIKSDKNEMTGASQCIEKSADDKDLELLKADKHAHFGRRSRCSSPWDYQTERGKPTGKTPDSSFSRDESNGLNLLDLSPISNTAGLNDSSTHHLSSEVLWITSSSSNSKEKTFEEKLKQQSLSSSDEVSNQCYIGLKSENSDAIRGAKTNLEFLTKQHNYIGAKHLQIDSVSGSAESFLNERTAVNNSFPVYEYHVNDENSTEFIDRTYPFIDKNHAIKNTWHSFPVALSSDLMDRRRYRTVVPLRVFTTCTEDFYPTEYDSFSPPLNSSWEKQFKSRNLSGGNIRQRKGSMFDRSTKSNPL